jgi:CRP-like cAMP-binding protein
MSPFDAGDPHAVTLARHILSRSVLAGLPADLLDHLASVASVEEVPPGEAVAREGDPAEAMYVLDSGLAELRLHDQGGERIVATLGPGDLIGWSWMVPPHLWQFDVLAPRGVVVARFSADDLGSIAIDDPAGALALNRAVAGVVARRLRDTRAQLLDLYRPGGDG